MSLGIERGELSIAREAVRRVTRTTNHRAQSCCSLQPNGYRRKLLGLKSHQVKTTRYFQFVVLGRRPYLRMDWIERVLQAPEHREVQGDGRIRRWGYIEELKRYLRVVTLPDGETVHNAFPDRGFEVPER